MTLKMLRVENYSASLLLGTWGGFVYHFELDGTFELKQKSRLLRKGNWLYKPVPVKVFRKAKLIR